MMTHEQEHKFYLRTAVAAMACDGNLDSCEVQVIQNFVQNSIYFDKYNNDELNILLEELKVDPNKFLDSVFIQLSKVELEQKKKYFLLEILIQIVEADKEITSAENAFIHKVCQKLQINIKELIKLFPQHADLFINTNTTSAYNFDISELE